MSDSATLELILRLQDQTGRGLDNLGRSLRDVEQQAQSSGGFLQNAFAFATGGALLGGLQSISDGFGDITSQMIGGNAQFETYNAQFTVLLKDADAAKQRMAELAEFGATTPFELPQVVEADRVLQGFGLHSQEAAERFGFSGEEIRRISGDVAAGTGADFQEMALLLGKFSTGATGEAISRMAELGITSRDELTKLGLEFDKSGALLSPLPESMNVVLALMKDKYGGLMEVQSGTFEGMVSNLEDWKSNTIRLIGAPIFEVVKAKLGDLLTFLNDPKTLETLNKLATALADGIGKAMTWLSETAIPNMERAWKDIQPTLDAAWKFFNDSLVPILRKLWEVELKSIQEKIERTSQAFKDFQPVLEGFGNFINTQVTPALEGMLKPLGGIQGLIDKLMELQGLIDKLPPGLGPMDALNPLALIESIGNISNAVQGRAGGGSVAGGTPYIVGERGPELFVPGRSGSIVPNGGGAVTVYVTVTGSVTAERDLAESIRQQLLSIQRRNLTTGIT